MIINSLDGFYRKNELQFLGVQYNFSIMTTVQINKALADGITLYNRLYPPQKSNNILGEIVKVAVISGLIALSGAAVLAAIGVPVSSAVSTVSMVGTATAHAGSVIAVTQEVAGGISTGGMIYAKITGSKPDDLIKAAGIISSKSGFDLLKNTTLDQLAKHGARVQANDNKSNALLNERIKREQQSMAEKLRVLAATKAKNEGVVLTTKKINPLTFIAPVAIYLLKSK